MNFSKYLLKFRIKIVQFSRIFPFRINNPTLFRFFIQLGHKIVKNLIHRHKS